MDEINRAVQRRRRGVPAIKGEKQVAGLRWIEVFRRDQAIDITDAVSIAIGAHREPGILPLVTTAKIAHGVVVDGLFAGLGNRKGDMGIIAALDMPIVEGNPRRLGLGLVIDALRQRGGTTCLVDRHREIRILLEQRQEAGRQFVLVLIGIGSVDGKRRLLVGEGIDIALFGLPACRRLGQAAVPGGNRAIGIAGLGGAGRRQILAEPVGFGRRQGGPRRATEKNAAGRGGDQTRRYVH